MSGPTLLLAALLALPRLLLAGEPPPTPSPLDGLCATVSAPCTAGPRIVVLSAFPAEQRALRASLVETERTDVLGRSVLLGRLAGQDVALGLTGMGLVNASAAAAALLDELDAAAVVFSGVAGSGLRIGDVAVPATWTDVVAGRSFGVDARLLAAAAAVGADAPALGRCTPVPPEPPGAEVCLPHAPEIVVGGEGQSRDPFGGAPLPCQPGGDEVFGCEAQPRASEPDATDMETAAVAAVAAARGVPFLGVRGVSDGTGDPLGLPGFPAQFFAYYRLAADNAAAVVARLLATLPAADRPRARRGHFRPRTAAACAFERAASTDCRGASAPPRVARLVSRACVLRARADAGSGVPAERWRRRAAGAWRRAATLAERSALPSCCATALAARLRAAAAATEIGVGADSAAAG